MVLDIQIMQFLIKLALSLFSSLLSLSLSLSLSQLDPALCAQPPLKHPRDHSIICRLTRTFTVPFFADSQPHWGWA